MYDDVGQRESEGVYTAIWIMVQLLSGYLDTWADQILQGFGEFETSNHRWQLRQVA